MWNRLFGGPQSGLSEDASVPNKHVSFSESTPATPTSPVETGAVRLSGNSDGGLEASSSGRVSVKNTFIEIEPDDEDDDQPTMSARCISAPAGALKRVSFSELDEQQTFDPSPKSGHRECEHQLCDPQAPSAGQGCPTTDDDVLTPKHLSEDGERSAGMSSLSSFSSSISSLPPHMSVKNTFVHYDDCDEEEQPEMQRRSMSGPVNLSVPSTEPVFIPLQAGQNQASEPSGASSQAAPASNAQTMRSEPAPAVSLQQTLSDEDKHYRSQRMSRLLLLLLPLKYLLLARQQ